MEQDEHDMLRDYSISRNVHEQAEEDRELWRTGTEGHDQTCHLGNAFRLFSVTMVETMIGLEMETQIGPNPLVG